MAEETQTPQDQATPEQPQTATAGSVITPPTQVTDFPDQGRPATEHLGSDGTFATVNPAGTAFTPAGEQWMLAVNCLLAFSASVKTVKALWILSKPQKLINPRPKQPNPNSRARLSHC